MEPENWLSEQQLSRIALVCSILGIIILFLLVRQWEITDTTIEKINNEQINDIISVTGTVVSHEQRGAVQIISIEQNNILDIIVFSNEPLTITKGDTIEVTGKYEDHQFIAHEIVN